MRAGPWYRLSQAVMRRPGPIAAATAALLIVMGLPFLRIEFTGVDASVLPQDRSARVVDDALDARVPARPHHPDPRRRRAPATRRAVARLGARPRGAASVDAVRAAAAGRRRSGGSTS